MMADRRALEGLPLKLMIVIFLISITYPIFANMLQDYDEELADQGARNEIERLCAAALSCYLAGPGNVRTLEIASSVTDVGSVIEIGGDLNSTQCRSVRCLQSDGTMIISYLDEVPVRMCAPEMGPLRIDASPSSVHMACVCDHNGTWVMVDLA